MSIVTEPSFTDISEVYLSELRRGNRVSLEALAKRFPSLADRILNELPAMAMLDSALHRSNAEPCNPLPSIPGFELLEELGQGTSGVVYRAKDSQTGNLVAIKLLRSYSHPADLLRFEREIESLSRVQHPRIVSVLSHGLANDAPYIVMSLIDGITCSELLGATPSIRAIHWISQLKRDWKLLAAWGADIASALQFVHQRRIIHRDIKPSNLLIDEEGNCWLSDFGLAKVCELGMTVSRTGQVIGTPRFMAPEQMRGRVDARSDIFALGRTLYELALIGIEVDDVQRSTEGVSIAVLNPAIPPELASIIDKACDPRPDLRFQTSKELVHVLTRYLNGARPSDRRRSGKRMSEFEFKAAMRRRVNLAMGASVAAFMVTLVVLVGGMLVSSREKALEQKSFVEADSLKRLAASLESSDEGFVEVIGEAIKSSVVQDKGSEDADVVSSKIDAVVNKVAKEGLKPGELDLLIQEYRNSAMMVANKILALNQPLRLSGLSHEQKLRGQQTLMLLAKAISNRRIESAEGERLLASLFNGQVPTLEQLIAMRIPDPVLASWLDLVAVSFQAQFSRIASEPWQLDELDGMLDRYLQSLPTN